jgi:hypothetical protein
VNAVAFRNAFGFDFAKLSTYLTPYLAARSAQVRTEWNDFHAVQVYSSPIGSTQALPTFSPAVITLNQVQRDWVTNRTTDEALKSISCNAHVTASASKNDLLIAKARAQNACDFALNQNANRRQGLTATAGVLVTSDESESGQVFVSFNG